MAKTIETSPYDPNKLVEWDSTLGGYRELIGGTLPPVAAASIASGSVTASTTATTLPSQACFEIEVQNDPGSAQNLLVGAVGQEKIVIPPGGSRILSVVNANVISYKAASGTGTTTLNWLAESS